MTRTILLADDSVTIQKVVELTFIDEDFRVVACGSGDEAISRLSEIAPDLVIADVHMPGADGYEVAETVRRERPGTPVLLLVGTFESFDDERAAEIGAAGHLKKPFDSQELLRSARELIAESGAPTSGSEPAEAAAEEPAPPEPELSFEPAPDLDLPAAPDLGAPAFAPAAAGEPVPEPVGSASGNGTLSDAEIERIAHRVAELIADKVLRDVAWEVVPDLAEVLLKARIRELEASVE